MSSALVPVDATSAERAGFSVLRELPSAVEPEAVRMLPETAPGVGIAIGGEVLMVAMPAVPTPAEFRQLEDASGMPVTVVIATGALWEHIRSQAAAATPARAPRAAGSVLAEAATAGATDVFLRAGDTPRVRVSGMVSELGRHPRLSTQDVVDAHRWLVGPDDDGDQVALASFGGARWRVASYRAGGHAELALRQLPHQPPRLEDLALPGAVADLARSREGLVVFAGPAGAGKTTSAAGLIDRINTTRHGRILTIEAPVEYRHTSRSCSVSQRQVGLDVPDFASALASAGPQLADVVLVGELGDAQTIRAALDAAQAGTLVVATLAAAASAEAAVLRLLTAFPDAEQSAGRAQLAAVLRGVIAQTLVPSAGGAQAVCEVLLGNEAVRTLVRQGRTHELGTVLEGQVHAGMTSLDRSLAYYTAAGRLEETAARAAATHPERFSEHLRRTPGAAHHTSTDSAAPEQHRPAGPSVSTEAPGAPAPGVLGQPPV